MSTPLTPKMAVKIQNDSGEEIPPHSVVVVSSVETVADTDTNESYSIHHVTKYTGQDGNILVTGPIRIRAGATGTGGWSAAKSFGKAYSDQRLYVAVDDVVDPPASGEEWGPIRNQWSIGRGGKGFFADGHPAVDVSNGFGVSRSIFYRTTSNRWKWVKILTALVNSRFDSPTFCYCDVWELDYTSLSSPQPRIRTSDPSLQNLRVVNYLPQASYSSSSSSGSQDLQGRIEWNDGQWELTNVYHVSQVVKSVSCSESGLSVTYGDVNG